MVESPLEFQVEGDPLAEGVERLGQRHEPRQRFSELVQRELADLRVTHLRIVHEHDLAIARQM